MPLLKVGIYDYHLEKLKNSSIKIEDRNIFILFDKTKAPGTFNSCLEHLKTKEYYVTDYFVYQDTSTSFTKSNHMIVVKVPSEYNVAFDNFVKGRYSKMYSKDSISKLFVKNKFLTDYKHFLLKTKTSLLTFKNTICEEFGMTIPELKDFNPTEYILPLKYEEETFNYKLNTNY